eukprot:gene36745-45328_t
MNHDKNVTTTVGHLIDGQIVADTERTQPVFNPATGQSTTNVALASKATVEAAIASAEAAFPAWRKAQPVFAEAWDEERAMTALELLDVRKSFGKSEIIRGAHLSIEQGDSGEIRLNGQRISGLKPYQINRLGLSRSFQISNLFVNLSVYENLRCAVLWSLGYKYSFWHRLGKLRDAHERAERVLEEIGLQRQRHVLAGVLTYAEQRALEIGITIAGGADVILLDEPTAGMSRSESDAAVELIRKVTVGKTLLMVEHDMSVVFGLADKIAVLVYGEVIACDTPERIRGNAAVQAAYLGGHEEAA